MAARRTSIARLALTRSFSAGSVAAYAVLTMLIAEGRAAEPRYTFHVYSHREGLDDLSVRSIYQDRPGFLWIGTDNGLFRFDGSRFRPFRTEHGLPNAHISSMAESADGKLWIGTRGGIAYLKGDRFVEVAVEKGASARSPSALASGPDGRFWFAGVTGLFVWDSRQSPGEPKFRRAELPGMPEIVGTRAVFVDSGGAVWFGLGNRIGRLQSGRFDILSAGAGVPDEDWGSILGDREGRVWIRSRNRIAVLDKGAARFQETERPSLPQGSRVEHLGLGPQGEVVASTHLGVYQRRGSGWRQIGHRHGLPADAVSCTLWDREGNPWIGMESHGLARWLGYREWESWTRAEGLSNEVVTSIARDGEGDLWVGTRLGLNRIPAGGGPIEAWTARRGLPKDSVRALKTTSDGSLWIGSGEGGLARMNLRTRRLRNYGPADGLADRNIVSMGLDLDRKLWVSTRRGWYRIDPLEDRARFEEIPLPLIEPSRAVYGAVFGSDERTWIATNAGLLAGRGGEWKRYGVKDGLRQDEIVCMAQAPDGAVWISYDQPYGVSRVVASGAGVQITHFDRRSGLRSGDVNFLGVDLRGRVWVGTGVGADLYDGASWRHFGPEDGLIWQDTTLGAFFADSDGSAWIGTNGGLSHYRPEGHKARRPPAVVLTAVRFGAETVPLSAAARVPYERNEFSVEFAGLTFENPQEVRYRYRLAGLRKDWIETDQNRLAFPGLPEGRFRFEVLARNAAGVWSESPAGFEFEILPPWWLTWWALAGGGGLALLAVGGVWRWRVHQLVLAKRRLEVAVRERTEEIEHEKAVILRQKQQIEFLLNEAREASRLKGEFLANLSHEIRTPMNGVMGMAALALGTELTAEQREYLETVRSCAESLLRLLNEILDLSKIEAGRLELENLEFSLSHCIERTVRMVAPAALEREIEIGSDLDAAVPEKVVGDSGRVEQVLLNLLSNAVKFTAAGRVDVQVKLKAESDSDVTVSFSILDTGIGIPAEKLAIIFEPFQQADGSTTRRYGGTGLGLAICARLVDLMGGHIGVESEPGRGSRFHFTLRFLKCNGEAAAMPVPPATIWHGSREVSVLVVEDNLVSQKVARGLLEKRGCRVATAGNGLAALETLDRERFDLVLMDIQMPELDGLAATRMIRERERRNGGRTPIFMLTASATAGERERCMEAGADGFLTKPLQPEKLDEMLSSLPA